MNKWQKKQEQYRLKSLNKSLSIKKAAHDRRYFGANKVTDIQKKALMYQSGGKCSKCGSGHNLSIVRKVAVKDGGSSWSISNMEVVCNNHVVQYENRRLNW
jgi:hypothetical protein